ncbi:manganese efflux pump [Paenibacillus sp. N3.4]|uniref:manganese efflux pump n=1 Tax=Paenibacillus sp. N3.4 TaxID=2603222 RepID=UPI0011CA7629|nr:sporulation membrane protein YtaF [Paenibacillus sp. N3.4]
MHWFSILGIGLASNLDNLGIGVSYGSRSIRIPFISNLMIAILSMLCSYVSIACGQFTAQFIPVQFVNTLGGMLIVGIGLWGMLSDHLKTKRPELLRNPSKADVDGNNIISVRESFMLGTALALNCIASGFGAGISGMSAWATVLAIGLFSLITVAVGIRVGTRIARTWLGKYANAIGGTLLVLIGCYEIFL